MRLKERATKVFDAIYSLFLAGCTIFAIGCLFFGIFSLTGCNRQIIDTHYSFDYAYVYLQDGTVVEGEVSSWRDFDSGDQIQITFKDGYTYLVHSMNCTLIDK